MNEVSIIENPVIILCAEMMENTAHPFPHNFTLLFQDYEIQKGINDLESVKVTMDVIETKVCVLSIKFINILSGKNVFSLVDLVLR